MSNNDLHAKIKGALAVCGIKEEDAPTWITEFSKYLYRHIVYTNTEREMKLEGRFFKASGGGIYDENFDFDAMMSVSGDFVDNQKQEYAEMIAAALNAAAHPGAKE